jgi:nucleoside phosphorylase
LSVLEAVRLPAITWPRPELASILTPLNDPSPNQELPSSKWLVITWTKDEHKALRTAFTPGVKIDDWYKYAHNFDAFIPDIHPGAPSRRLQHIGSYYKVKIGNKDVLCFKSEFHLNQDGKKLPLKKMVEQIIEETNAKFVLSIGTAGGVAGGDELGDVVVSNSALFNLKNEFKNESFNHKKFQSSWDINETLFHEINSQMISIQEPGYAPPTKRIPFEGQPLTLPPNTPDINYQKNHPILTTDFFEFGNSINHLDKLGSAVEMDDAVIAMVCDEMLSIPNYAFVRNISDPVLNGDLEEKIQIMWAVWYHTQFGIQTSFNGALATWSIIAGN